MEADLDLTELTVVPSSRIHWERETDLEHGSKEWYGAREGMTIGSSSAGAVFSGVVTGSARRELIRSFQGIPKPQPSAFSQSLMNEGHRMEPHLAQELKRWFPIVIGSRLYRNPTLSHGVQEISTPDRIVVCGEGMHARVALAEIKWRPSSPDDCGWGPNRDRLSAAVWCQAQHQMAITGIEACIVYAGSPSGARRMWSIRFSPAFRTYWLEALKACVMDVRFDSEGTCEVKIGNWIRETASEVWSTAMRDSEVEEIKGGNADDF